MAFAEYNIWSAVLGRHCRFNAVVPQIAPFKPERNRGKAVPRREYPLLLLLHGLGENADAWRRGCAIEHFAAESRMVVVMPDGGRSFYNKMHHGEDFWSFTADELPEICRQILPVSGRREETFAAGISMGGYGALHLGLAAPERFSKVAGISSFTDVKEHLENPFEYISSDELYNIFGSSADAAASGKDLFALVASAAASVQKCEIGMFCGEGDFLFRENRKLAEHLAAFRTISVHQDFSPGGHDWDYWNLTLPRVFRFFTGR